MDFTINTIITPCINIICCAVLVYYDMCIAYYLIMKH